MWVHQDEPESHMIPTVPERVLGGQISKLQIANATDTATYSKSQLPESTKLCKLVLKVRFALRYVRKHTKS